MHFLRRLQFWGSVGIAWAAALLALYIHPAIWALFAIVLSVLVVRQIRSWGEEASPPAPLHREMEKGDIWAGEGEWE